MQNFSQRYFSGVIDYRFHYNGMEVDDEVSGSGNSYTTQFRQYDPRLGRWKSLDPKAYKFIDKSPYFGMGNNPIYFVDLFGGEPTPAEAAAMSKHVYGGADAADGVLIGGWEVDPDQDSYGLIPAYDSGFKAQVYRRKKSDGTYEYFYATAGTEDLTDVGEDLDGRLGEGHQFKISVTNAQTLDKIMKVKGAELTFGGHSLGGGLATVNALATGRKAINFNPMGMTDDLKKYCGVENKSGEGLITNYIIWGEALWAYQILDPFIYYEGDNIYLWDGYYFAEKFIPEFIPGGSIYKGYQAAKRHTIDYVIGEMKEAKLWKTAARGSEVTIKSGAASSNKTGQVSNGGISGDSKKSRTASAASEPR